MVLDVYDGYNEVLHGARLEWLMYHRLMHEINNWGSMQAVVRIFSAIPTPCKQGSIRAGPTLKCF
jgi:hypothetical protein